MKKLFFLLIGYISSISLTFADGGILGNFKGSGGDTDEALRTGDVHIDDIPVIIKGAINFFMGIAGSVAIIFIILGAYKILFGSLEQDKTKGKDTIIMALGGFVIAALAWYIIGLIINNLT